MGPSKLKLDSLSIKITLVPIADPLYSSQSVGLPQLVPAHFIPFPTCTLLKTSLDVYLHQVPSTFSHLAALPLRPVHLNSARVLPQLLYPYSTFFPSSGIKTLDNKSSILLLRSHLQKACALALQTLIVNAVMMMMAVIVIVMMFECRYSIFQFTFNDWAHGSVEEYCLRIRDPWQDCSMRDRYWERSRNEVLRDEAWLLELRRQWPSRRRR